MKRLGLIIGSAAVLLLTPSLSAKTPQLPGKTPNYGNLPLTFELNQGQADASIQFVSHGDGYAMAFRSGEILLVPPSGGPQAAKQSALHNSSLIGIELSGADAHASSTPEDLLVTRTNYFLGNNPAQWHTGIPNYSRIRYHSVYPGIDLVYYGNQRRLEHDFIVAPNADPGKIAISFEGTKNLAIERASGDLILKTSTGNIRLLKPVSYQESEGRRTKIASRYKLLAHDRVGFSLGSYNRARPLVIDPILVYSTLLSSYSLTLNAMAVDTSGHAYVTGGTSAFFPVTKGAFQTTTSVGFGGTTAFVAKFNSSGTALVYATYLGGSSQDIANAIAVDGSSNAYITGSAQSTDFPVTSGAFQKVQKGSLNAFVSKLNATGSALIYSTYLGGSGGGGDQYSYINGDSGNGIALDSVGDVYITGTTQSTDFPVTSGAFQTTYRGTAQSPRIPNAFVTKLNAAGSSLIYSTFLGGTGHIGYFYTKLGDISKAITIDSSGNAYVAGLTYSADFPITSGAFQATQKGAQTSSTATSNAFVSKLSADGTSLVYSTYLGGTTATGQGGLFGDAAYAITLDSTDEAFIAGHASSPDFPVTGSAYQTSANGGHPAFVTALNTTGTALVYSTFLGGNGYDSANGISLDSAGDAYITGTSTDYAPATFPVTPSAFESTYLPYSSPAFVTELNPTGSNLIYSTLLNGLYEITGSAIAVVDASHVYVAGTTSTIDFPTTAGAFESSLTFGQGGFIAELDISSALGEMDSSTTLTATPNPQILGLPVHLSAQVAAMGSGTVPQGNVNFRVNGKIVATVALSPTGLATYTTTTISSNGSIRNSLAADYQGSSLFNPSGAIIPETITPIFTTSISGGNQQTFYGKSFPNPLVVEVDDENNNPVPGDTVVFSGNGLLFSPSSAVTGSDGRTRVMVFASKAGSLTASATVTGMYYPAATFSLLSSKDPLYISAKNVAITYGQTPSALSAYTLTGFINGDTASVVTGVPVLTTSVGSTTPVGVYPISVGVGTLAAQNYYFDTFSNGEGAIQVVKAPLHIKPSNVTIHAGDPLPAFTYTLSGFVNGETQATATTGAASLSTTATTPTKVGRYYIIGAQGSLQAHNYGFLSYVTDYGILTVIP